MLMPFSRMSVFALLFVSMLGVGSLTAAAAEPAASQDAVTAVDRYINVMQQGDLDTMVNVSIDMNDLDEESQRQEKARIIEEAPLQDIVEMPVYQIQHMEEGTLYGPVATVHNSMYVIGWSDIDMNVIRGALNLFIHLLAR